MAGILGLQPLPGLFLLALAGIVAVYAAAEVAKRFFYWLLD